jgi:hypothetical protein
MPAYILIPFAVFFACSVAQFWFTKRVRDALIERHPDTFLAIEKSSIFPMQGIRRFMRKGRYKALNDPELDTHVRNLRRLYAVAIVAWLAFGVMLVAWGMTQQ